MSHIHWYKEIVEALPFPVIVSGHDAGWLQINIAAREIAPEQMEGLKELAGRHLKDADSDTVNKAVKHNGLEYQIIMKHFRYGGSNSGYLIIMSNPQKSDVYESVISILCSSTDILVGHSTLQTEIINKLAAVIAGIASGGLHVADLNKEMADIKWQMENRQIDMNEVNQNIEKLAAARNAVINFRGDL